MTKLERETQSAAALKELRDLLPAGSTVYTILRDVSRSGLSRKISLVIFRTTEQGEVYPLNLTNLVARALDMRTKTGFNDSIIVGGVGTDAGFHLVYSIAQALGYSRGNEKYEGATNAYGLIQRWL